MTQMMAAGSEAGAAAGAEAGAAAAPPKPLITGRHTFRDMDRSDDQHEKDQEFATMVSDLARYVSPQKRISP